MNSIANIKAKGVVVSSFISSDSASDIRVNINTVDEDVLSNLESDSPAAGCLSNFDEGFSLRDSSTAVADIRSKLTSNGAELSNSGDILVSGKIADSGLDFSDESLDVSDAFKREFETSDNTFNET